MLEARKRRAAPECESGFHERKSLKRLRRGSLSQERLESVGVNFPWVDHQRVATGSHLDGPRVAQRGSDSRRVGT